MSRYSMTTLTRLAAVTPSDSEDLGIACRVLNVATSGVVKVTTIDGDVGDITISAGVPFPIAVRRVWATGTSATGIRALS